MNGRPMTNRGVPNKRQAVYDALMTTGLYKDDPELGLTASEQAVIATDALIAVTAVWLWADGPCGDASC